MNQTISFVISSNNRRWLGRKLCMPFYNLIVAWMTAKLILWGKINQKWNFTKLQ